MSHFKNRTIKILERCASICTSQNTSGVSDTKNYKKEEIQDETNKSAYKEVPQNQDHCHPVEQNNSSAINLIEEAASNELIFLSDIASNDVSFFTDINTEHMPTEDNNLSEDLFSTLGLDSTNVNDVSLSDSTIIKLQQATFSEEASSHQDETPLLPTFLHPEEQIVELYEVGLELNTEHRNSENISSSTFDEDVMFSSVELESSTISCVPSVSSTDIDNRPGLSSNDTTIFELPQALLPEEASGHHENVTAVGNVLNPDEQAIEVDEHTSKKRRRNEKGWKKNVRKYLRNRGQEYTSVKGKVINEKSYRFFLCKCNFNCEKNFPDETRRQIYERFYNLENWELQTMYIQSAVKICPIGRKRTQNENSKRKFTRKYFFIDSENKEKEVCKNVFKQTLRLSGQRIAYAISKSTPKDNRGKHEPHNKTNAEALNRIRNFIKSFPAYQSHYSRKKNPNRLYLSPTLNKTKMYSLYVEYCKQQEPEIQPEKFYIFNKVFNEDFNLHFHPPQKDTCKTCNILQNKINNCTNEIEKEELKNVLSEHHIFAERARLSLKTDGDLSKLEDFNTVVICFDLMKTLPTPHLDVNVVYYKRQLWTYLLGIHNVTTGEVYMYLWHEGLASRGPEEVASCILHFFKHFMGQKDNVIMYSDQCGGQNKNIKMVTLMDYVVNSGDYKPKKIEHKFLVPGHTYLPCDQDFGIIEKSKRNFKDIFVPHDWTTVVTSARKKNPFVAVEMTSEDFISQTELAGRVTNRKKNLDKELVQWRRIVHLQMNEGNDLVMLYKYDFDNNVNFEEVNLKKRKATERPVTLPLLYPRGRKVDAKKLKDIKDLMQYILPMFHEFYDNLSPDNDVEEHIWTSSDEDDDEDI